MESDSFAVILERSER